MKREFTYYQIAVIGEGQTWGSSWIRCDGWSGYNDRLTLSRDGLIPESEVYGPEQVAEHIKELRSISGEYSEYWKTVGLRIEKITQITEVVSDLNPA